MRVRVHVQVDHFGEVGTFDQDLLPWNEPSDQISLGLIEMKPLGVSRSIHAGIREEHLGRAGLDDYREQVRAVQIIAGLSCQNQGCILLAPGLKCLDDVALYRAVAKEAPGL